eukprot:TRINITY_DN22015_c0_g1_i1.p1 TRINITY_DN22015_c0_g1~~TRINITY_DN22015_c0_g1_i1.p1  ORF type:complete len:137 (+),score=42.27 TRINITY_DN22015_c0_g1_i1:102-512(+)
MPAGCLVCQEPSTKYRFPCCRERYCSLQCYRVHAQSPCFGRVAMEQERETKRRKAQEAEKEDDGEDDLLSEVRLCALRGHKNVREALRSRRFQQLLSDLDAAADRRKTLENLIQHDAYFVKFVENMMEAVDFVATK